MTITETKNQSITPLDTIEDIFNRFPQKAQKLAYELTRWGLQCVGCSAATWETLESGVMKHGKTQADLYKLVERLNQILQETSSIETISMTLAAATKFKQIREAEGAPTAGLLFGERAAGCSGFEYTLEFTDDADDDAKSDKISFESHGITIHVHKNSLSRLLGCEIDYVDGLHSGFKITNPNVQSSCGCGSSHGYQ